MDFLSFSRKEFSREKLCKLCEVFALYQIPFGLSRLADNAFFSHRLLTGNQVTKMGDIGLSFFFV